MWKVSENIEIYIFDILHHIAGSLLGYMIMLLQKFNPIGFWLKGSFRCRTLLNICLWRLLSWCQQYWHLLYICFGVKRIDVYCLFVLVSTVLTLLYSIFVLVSTVLTFIFVIVSTVLTLLYSIFVLVSTVLTYLWRMDLLWLWWAR